MNDNELAAIIGEDNIQYVLSIVSPASQDEAGVFYTQRERLFNLANALDHLTFSDIKLVFKLSLALLFDQPQGGGYKYD